MSKTTIKFIIIGLVLVLIQALVLDNVCLFNVAVPILFVYVIFKLPMTLNTNIALTIAFFLGLIIDIFSNSYGMNALCCTVAAMVRKGIFHLYMPRVDSMPDPIPSERSMGRYTYLKYLSTMTLIYCTMIFVIEALTFFNVWLTIARIVASTVLSLLLMVAVDSLTTRTHEKRL